MVSLDLVRRASPTAGRPRGTGLVDGQGRDVRETSRPQEPDRLTQLLGKRGQRVVFGAYDSVAGEIAAELTANPR